MNEALLQKIEDSLQGISSANGELRTQMAETVKHSGELQTRVAVMAEQLKAHEAWRAEAERRFESNAHGGNQALLEAMTPEQRAWIPFARMLEPATIRDFSGDPAKFESEENEARLTSVRNALSAVAAKNPILYVGVGSWFQSKIKAALAAKNGNPKAATEWHERADKLAEALGGFHPLSKIALQEDTAGDGGALVPVITEALIGAMVKESSVVRRAGATVLPMTTKTHVLPSLANDFSVTWTAEEGTITDSAPAVPFASGNLVAKKQTGLVTVSIELLQDNVIGLMDFVMAHLIQQIGRAEDAEALEGAGTVFTGLYAASGVVAVAGGSNALTFDELVRLIYGAEHQATMDRGVLFCHPWVVRDAIQLATGTAGTPWLPFSVQGEARPRNLLGVPTYATSVILRNRGAGTNETTAYHGNPAFIVIGDRMGTQFDVDPYGLFASAQVRLRLLRRVGILVWVPAYFTKLTAVTVTA